MGPADLPHKGKPMASSQDRLGRRMDLKVRTALGDQVVLVHREDLLGQEATRGLVADLEETMVLVDQGGLTDLEVLVTLEDGHRRHRLQAVLQTGEQ